ncbi:hypothetical protein PROAA_1230009 [Candidatus Propionivibrio aalborgensis]|uniref:Uncharacterized protein n=1 Tax=Candidatus Propionivibrio aalborgensis TaxID=1860101 RepID=A0A1A8XG54_9RHOO|nr:hypothetical protein PROAA_1230009 [Candidatus Propionivibrio aalborgensis]
MPNRASPSWATYKILPSRRTILLDVRLLRIPVILSKSVRTSQAVRKGTGRSNFVSTIKASPFLSMLITISGSTPDTTWLRANRKIAVRVKMKRDSADIVESGWIESGWFCPSHDEILRSLVLAQKGRNRPSPSGIYVAQACSCSSFFL